MHTGVHGFLQKLKVAGVSRNIPNISWNTAHFLKQTLENNKISSVLEIGSANGFSTICLAEYMRDIGGQIVSIEMSRHAYEEACQNFESYSQILGGTDADSFSPANLNPKVTSDTSKFEVENIKYFFGNALEVLPQFIRGQVEVSCKSPFSIFTYDGPNSFDLIFIDGQFVDTLEFYQLSVQLLSKNGVIIVDDAIKFAWKMKGFFEYLDGHNIQYELHKLDEDDGVLLIGGTKLP